MTGPKEFLAGPLHGGQVDHQRPVGHGMAGRGVPAAADADRQALVAGKAHRRGHVACPAGAGDQRGMAVDRAVPYLARRVVPIVTRRNQLPVKVGVQLVRGGAGSPVSWAA